MELSEVFRLTTASCTPKFTKNQNLAISAALERLSILKQST